MLLCNRSELFSLVSTHIRSICDATAHCFWRIVCLLTGGVCPTPRMQTPLDAELSPPADPLDADSPLTVNMWVVHILRECILLLVAVVHGVVVAITRGMSRIPCRRGRQPLGIGTSQFCQNFQKSLGQIEKILGHVGHPPNENLVRTWDFELM